MEILNALPALTALTFVAVFAFLAIRFCIRWIDREVNKTPQEEFDEGLRILGLDRDAVIEAVDRTIRKDADRAKRKGRGPGAEAEVAVMEINSNPKGAEIEIDGAFAGTTPRTKRLGPGEYKIKITINGYKSWERDIRVEAGEEIPIAVELQKN